ncbi:MAG: DNA-3-methyladenine glycosylase I [Candidatus Lokiarchaeota archaeon]|nr:DNA-3-methyladenine glycosylase I [Candidatus Lokiarchaeota archaeon]
MVTRCEWAGNEPLMREYHDKEWGTPQHEDQILYELLILEGMQAGLSWSTVLKKRENFRKAFDNFDYKIISKYDENKVEKLLLDKGIIRNRLKINSVITNAKLFIKIQEESGSFNNYIWKFVNNKPIDNQCKSMSDIPAHTELSDLISKDMKKRGFKFIGTTIIYAFMQAIGMVNDHATYCFRHEEIKKSMV